LARVRTGRVTWVRGSNVCNGRSFLITRALLQARTPLRVSCCLQVSERGPRSPMSRSN
jgi:hypothetical protein